MTDTTTAIKEAGFGQGFGDADNWIEDEERSIRTADTRDESVKEQLADKLRAALSDQTGADEALVNALTGRELDEQMGFAARLADGTWTGDAEDWLAAYNAGWRSCVQDRLAKLEEAV